MPSFLRSNRPGVLYATLALLLTAFLFGGASRLDVLPPILPRIVAAAALAWLFWATPPRSFKLPGTALLLLIVALAIPALQLVPLPLDLWSSLPGRDHARRVYELIGEAPWQPVSLTPSRTLNALLALLPATATFLLVSRLDTDGRGALVGAVALTAVASALLGLVQFASGPESALYFYRVTNADSSVGFFSNANHHALFLGAGALCVLVWLGSKIRERGKMAVAEGVVATAGIVVLFASIAATASRAGAGLAVVALVGGLALLPWSRLGVGRRKSILLTLAPALALAGGLALLYSGALGDRFMIEDGENERVTYLPVFVRIVLDHLPFGSGLGSFDPVFRRYETVDALYFNYLNNAHNDYAQVAIETGLPGIAAMIGFAAWFGFMGWRAWFRPDESERVTRQQRAASIIVLMVLAHSAVDYPLRTAAVSSLFALACAFLTPPSTTRRQLAASRPPNLGAQPA